MCSLKKQKKKHLYFIQQINSNIYWMNAMGYILGDWYCRVAIPLSIYGTLEETQISFGLVSAKIL